MWYLLLIIVPLVLVVIGCFFINRAAVPTKTKILSDLHAAYDKKILRISYQNQCGENCTKWGDFLKKLEEKEGLAYSLAEILPNTTFAKYLHHRQMAVVKMKEGNDSSERISLTAYVNDTYLHSMPVILNKISNWFAVMHNLSKMHVNSKPYQTEDPTVEIPSSINIGIILIGLAMNMIPTGLAFDIVEDRTVKVENT